MKKREIVRKIEQFAPLETQEKWDCSGWLVETEKSRHKKNHALLDCDRRYCKTSKRAKLRHDNFAPPIVYSATTI